MTLNLPNNVVGGTLLLILALVFFTGSLQLDIGAARQMGPGYFPLVASGFLFILALSIIVVPPASESPSGRADLRALLGIILGVATFALLVPWLGMLPAVFCAVLACSLPDSRLPFTGKISLALALAVAVWLIFILGLGLPFTPIGGR